MEKLYTEELSVLGWRFWDLWLQKIFRNFSSMKCLWLFLLYVPVVYGMYDGKWIDGKWVAKISAAVGCGALFGGFVTLALGRIYTDTRLIFKNGNGEEQQ